MKDRKDILFLKFEDMKADLHGVIRQVAAFLQKPFTEQDIEKLANHVSFDSMKVNPSVNYGTVTQEMQRIHGVEKKNASFIRKGKVGGWKEEMSPDAIKKMDDWIHNHYIPGLYEPE